ncbi:MAG: bacillithiol biosynthesis cysteine-adding enzyme BshC [bacterium]
MRTAMSQLPGATPLLVDYFEHFDRVADFFNGDFRNRESFQKRSEEVKQRELPFGKLVPILKEQNQRFGCGFQTLEKIDLLLERRACAVVTGQQTGLFSGPLYTIYKALTTIRLANRLNRTCEGCYVPVFWLASDDHDFREVNHAKLINKSHQIVEIAHHSGRLDRRVPVSAIKLNQEIVENVQQLNDATNPSEFKEDILKLLSAAYAPGAVFSQAFGTWLMALFKAFGLILMDASDTRVKTLGAPVFLKEIAERSPSTDRVLATSAELAGRGYHNQVQLNKGLLNLFYLDGERHALEVKDGTFHVKGTNQAFQSDELVRLAEKEPQRFSPNVLLRPIFQDVLLPTVAYVGGPAEIAYYAQLKGVYESFELPMPIIYPRKSLTLLERNIEKVLDKYELRVPEFWGDVEALINEIAKNHLPDSLEENIENTAKQVKENLAALEEVVVSFEPTLNDTVQNVKGRIDHQMEILEKKILQAYKKRNEILRQQIHKAQINLYPNHHLQEREVNVVPYLFKYGLGLIDRLYEAMDISNFDHQVVRL